MSKKKTLTNAELRAKIQAGINFDVRTNDERKRALFVASVLDADIITRENPNGSFRIYIPSDVPN